MAGAWQGDALFARWRGDACGKEVARGHLNSLKDGRDAKGGVTIDYFQYLVVAKAFDAMEGFNII